jgi:hypothetical protein
VTFIQRFGSALNLTPHFHSLVLDGVYAGPAHHPGHFVPLPSPTTEDVARVMAGTARRVMRLLEKRGLAGSDDPLASEDPLLATLIAASIRSRIATGQEAGQPWRRLGDRVEPVEPGQEGGQSIDAPPPRCVREGGMSLHADVSVPARDRQRLERLCRYVARPPLAIERLESMQNGLLAYRLKTRWRDGTTHILMQRHELLERLAPLIPPPRSHQVRYHGLLAPCASGRDRIVPEASRGAGRQKNGDGHEGEGTLNRQGSGGGLLESEQRAGAAPNPLSEPNNTNGMLEVPALEHSGTDRRSELKPTHRSGLPRRPPSVRRLRWAELLKRVFELEALRCPVCKGRMRVLAAITQPDVAGRILKCLALPARAPPIAAPVASAEHLCEPVVDDRCEESLSPFDDLDQTPPEDSDLGA